MAHISFDGKSVERMYLWMMLSAKENVLLYLSRFERYFSFFFFVKGHLNRFIHSLSLIFTRRFMSINVFENSKTMSFNASFDFVISWFFMASSVDLRSLRTMETKYASRCNSWESFGACLTLWTYLKRLRKTFAARSANCAASAATSKAEMRSIAWNEWDEML